MADAPPRGCFSPPGRSRSVRRRAPLGASIACRSATANHAASQAVTAGDLVEVGVVDSADRAAGARWRAGVGSVVYPWCSHGSATSASSFSPSLCRSVMLQRLAPGWPATEEAQDRGLPAARLRAIKQDIANNLARPGLSVAALADQHSCTPRSVQRLFETAGTTFTEYVLDQRLMQAYRVLNDPRRNGSKICAIAYDCGFGDVSYFNRMFRRRFGAAPSGVCAQARGLLRDC